MINLKDDTGERWEILTKTTSGYKNCRNVVTKSGDIITEFFPSLESAKASFKSLKENGRVISYFGGIDPDRATDIVTKIDKYLKSIKANLRVNIELSECEFYDLEEGEDYSEEQQGLEGASMYYAQIYDLNREYLQPKRSEFSYCVSIQSCFVELYEELALRGIDISNLPDISGDYPRGKCPEKLERIKLKLESLVKKPSKNIDIKSKESLKEILYLIYDL